jgi:RNA polymerase sigma-70 factor, ECF subfamily
VIDGHGHLRGEEWCRLTLIPGEQILPMSQAPSASEAEPRPSEIGELFSAYHQRVSLWVRRLGGPAIDVDDAVQEVFLVAHRRLPRITENKSINVWLYRVTENVVRHQRRGLWRQRQILADSQAQSHLLAEGAAPGDLAQEQEAQRQGSQLIHRVLDRMGERSRTLIILFELEELSGQEIAELKGVKVSTVWVWLHRARAEFRRHLAALEPAPPSQRELNDE